MLKKYLDKTVALVEFEKTAIICSVLMPDYIWIATGRKSQFNERLKILYGRDVVAFPDVDGYNEWCEKVKGIRKRGISRKSFGPDRGLRLENLLNE